MARTAKQRAALKKAQAASARKRRKGGTKSRKKPYRGRFSNNKAVNRTFHVVGATALVAGFGIAVAKDRRTQARRRGRGA